jgi:hypothetical protein
MSSWSRKCLALLCGGALSLGMMGVTATALKAQSETSSTPSGLGASDGHNEVCQKNLRELHRALTSYVQTNQKFPHAEKWTGALQPLVPSQDAFHCPSSPGGKWGYAFNAKLSEKPASRVKVPHLTHAFYETGELAPNVRGTGKNMAHRHKTTQPKPTLSHAVTVDGRVNFAKSSRKPYFGLKAPIPPARH